jgi:hypothetical protein
MNGGIDNHITQSQPLRSRDNIYEYKDSPAKYPKSQSDLNSVRSPSSLGMTQMTKVSGSQSSLRSAISLKEPPMATSKAGKEVPVKEKYQEREIDVKSDKSEPFSTISSSASTNNSSIKKSYQSSSPVPRPRTPKSSMSSRTILDGGIPQTEV